MNKIQIDDINNRYMFTSISLLISENCNLSCKYCYEVNSTGHKNLNMSENVAKKSVDFLFNEASLSKEDKRVNICLFGGEPTLNPEIIDLICLYGKEKSEEFKIDFNVSMITNSTIMNKKLYNIIKRHIDIFDSCQLSIDGPNDIQDTYRVFKSGTGSFSTVAKNIVYWKELFKDSLNIHGVINKSSVSHLYDSFIFFRENWNIKALWFLPSKDPLFDLSDVEIYRIQLGKIYDYIINNVRKTNSKQEIEYYAPLNRSLKDSNNRSKPCGAGNTYGCITSNGDIYPCHHFYWIDTNQETKIGNIFTTYNPMKKLLFEAYDDADMTNCEGCDHMFCYRCIAENYEQFGSPFIQIKDIHCEFMKVDLYYQNKIKKDLEELKNVIEK